MFVPLCLRVFVSSSLRLLGVNILEPPKGRGRNQSRVCVFLSGIFRFFFLRQGRRVPVLLRLPRSSGKFIQPADYPPDCSSSLRVFVVLYLEKACTFVGGWFAYLLCGQSGRSDRIFCMMSYRL